MKLTQKSRSHDEPYHGPRKRFAKLVSIALDSVAQMHMSYFRTEYQMAAE